MTTYADYDCPGCKKPIGDVHDHELIVDEDLDLAWHNRDCFESWEQAQAERDWERRYQEPGAWEGGFAANH